MRGDAIDEKVLEGLRLLHREGKPDGIVTETGFERVADTG